MNLPPTDTRPGWVPDDLYPFERHFTDVDGALVHYVDEGDGPPSCACMATRPGPSSTGG